MIDVRHLAAALAVAALMTSSAASASADLARSKNCVACHHVERKMVGPAYNAIAAKYAGDDAAVGTLSEKVIKGGGGVWSQMPMPPQPTVSPEEAEALVKWILSHR